MSKRSDGVDGGQEPAALEGGRRTVVANNTGPDSVNMVTARSEKIVKSARRTFQILEFFDQVERPATLTEIAGALDLPVSSASTLLRILLDLGYLAFDKDARKFSPTMRVALLGNWVRNQVSPDVDVVSVMSDLHAACGHTIMAGYLNGLYVQYIHVLQGVTPVRFYLKPGSSRIAVRSTLGWALLSLKTEKEVQRIWLHAQLHLDSSSPIDLATLQHCVSRARQVGYAATRSLGTEGVGVIAAIMSSAKPHPPIAIGIGGPNDMMDAERETLVSLLFETVNRGGL